MQVIYVAGKFMADSEYEVNLNIQAAAKVGLECAKKGWSPIIPHKNTGGFENVVITENDIDFWYDATMELLLRSDAIVMVPGWTQSQGAKMELEMAKTIGKIVYMSLEEVENLNAS